MLGSQLRNNAWLQSFQQMTKSCRFWWFIVCLKCTKDFNQHNQHLLTLFLIFLVTVKVSGKCDWKNFYLRAFMFLCVCLWVCTHTHIYGCMCCSPDYNLLKYFLGTLLSVLHIIPHLKFLNDNVRCILSSFHRWENQRS